MADENDNGPVCNVCGQKMNRGIVAVRLNRYCIRHFEGWYCPSASSC